MSPSLWWKQEPTPGPRAHLTVPVGALVAAKLFWAPHSCSPPLVPAAPGLAGRAVGSSHHPAQAPETAGSCSGTSWGQGQQGIAPSRHILWEGQGLIYSKVKGVSIQLR